MTPQVMVPTRDPNNLSPLERFIASFPVDQREEAIGRFYDAHTALERENLRYAWYRLHARPNQRMPRGDWDIWQVRAGRGFGKTRIGSESVRRRVNRGRARAVALIAPTASDARDVMVEGESGILAVHPADTRPVYKPSNLKLEWPNGAVGFVRSAEEPDRLRGLNIDLIWGDEPASWKTGSAAWDNALLGNRRGTPKAILTGTPRPLPWLREIERLSRTVVTRGTTFDNAANLADAFIRLVVERYGGTRLGRQELLAEFLDDTEGALWVLATIEAHRIVRFDRARPAESLADALIAQGGVVDLARVATLRKDRRKWRTIIAVDPPGETAECGISVATAPTRGVSGRDHAVILADETVEGRPEEWGAAVVKAWRTWGADAVYVEANQGGDMCRSTIHAVDPDCPVKKIRAKASKKDRAEPVAALYERGWVHHYGHFPKLEDQLTTWVPDESASPDRLDSVVHAIRELLVVTPVAPAKVLSPLGHRIR